MLVISKSQKVQLSPAFFDQQSKMDIRDAVAAWMALKQKWENEFSPKNTLSLEQIYNIARWLYLWAGDHEFKQQACYITLVVLIVKALHYGGNKHYVEEILNTIETFGTQHDDIESALTWLDYAIDAKIGLENY